MDQVVVLGGGVAGARAVAALREYGFAGRIVLVCQESHLPYDRPPLSKDCLVEPGVPAPKPLHPEGFYEAHDIAVKLGAAAVGIDCSQRKVELADGSAIAYDHLILATGGVARTLAFPGSGLQSVLTLRTLDDATAIRGSLKPAANVVILGGGFIGLEVAAAAAAHDCAVTVVEREQRLAARVAPPAISEALATLHRSRDVDIQCGSSVTEARGDGRVRQVTLDTGERLACDLLLVGVGMSPNLALAQSCGLDIGDGVLTDAEGRTSDPHIFAVGDIACAFNPAVGRQLRVESWESARLQAAAAAAAIVGRPNTPPDLPWAWSDQFDRTLQILGLPSPDLQSVARQGDDPLEVIVFGLRDGRIAHVAALGRVGDFAIARRLAKTQATVSPEQLANPHTPLRALLPVAALG